MSSELTPAEISFFETGELPAELAAPEPSAPEAPVEPAPPEPEAAPAEPVPVAPPTIDPAAELRQQLEADNASRRALEARINELKTQIDKATAPPKAAAPDPVKDPLGAMLHDLSTLKESLNGLQQKLTLAEQQAQQQQQLSEFTSNMQRLRDDFVKTTPDFHAAYAHLRAARAADLRDVGLPEAQIPEALLRDEIAVAMNAQQQGKNPAQVLYNMAKRYGYKAQPSAAVSPQAKIELAQKGTAAAVAPQKGAADMPLTLAGLKDASDADLSRIAQDDAMWHKIMGGRSKGIF